MTHDTPGIRGSPLVAVLLGAGVVTACTGGASAGRSDAMAERLVLAPKALSVVAGGSWQFVATRIGTDASRTLRPVAYAATGGVITSGGMYTAGAAAGRFEVIATLRGGDLADTAIIVITPSHTYTTSFPLSENPISEGGRWMNGGTVGLDWTNVSTSPGLAIGHQVGPSYTDGTALLNGDWGADQKVAGTVYSVHQNDACYQEVELRLRSSLRAHLATGYEIMFKASQTSDAYVVIARWNGPLGDFTPLASVRGARVGVTTGDIVSGTVVGNVITAYKNGELLLRIGDTTVTSGSPGIGFNLENAPAGCAGTNGDYGFASFTATDSL